MSQQKLNKAKELAVENYDTWGQWVVECMTSAEILESIGTDSVEEWVKVQEAVAERYQEIENTKF